MSKRNTRLFATLANLALMALSWSAQAATLASIDDIEAYGVYLKVEDGYQAIPPVQGMDSLNYDFSFRLLTMPVAKTPATPVELVIYSSGFEPDWSRFEARPMDVPGGNAVIYPTVAPLKEDQFKLTFNDPIREDSILLVDTGCCRATVYAVALSEPEPQLLRLFAPGTEHNPVSAEFVLDRVLSRVDASQQMTDLHNHWKNEVQLKEASDYFVYIDEAWQKYEAGETTEERINALQQVQGMSERYIEDFPQGRELEKVKERLAFAKGKLDV